MFQPNVGCGPVELIVQFHALILTNKHGLNVVAQFHSTEFSIARYKVGQRFGQHYDASADLGEGKRTYYTLLIYLSGSFKPKANSQQSSPQDSSETLVGGETVFYGPGNGVVAEVNPFLVFFLFSFFFFFLHDFGVCNLLFYVALTMA